MTVISPDFKVSDIARFWPATMKVFARYKLDLCCGGVHPLRTVAEKHGLDLAKLLEELNQAVDQAAVLAEHR